MHKSYTVLTINKGQNMFNSLENPVLKTQCGDIVEFDKSIENLAAKMLKVLKKDSTGIGLAANQIGVKKRIVIVDTDSVDISEEVLINPTISDSDELWTYEEGCLSIPGFYYPIIRPKIVNLKAQRLDGSEFEIELDVLEARLMLHEIDHLNGLCMFDRIPEEEMSEAQKIYQEVLEGKVCRSARSDSDPEL